MKNQGLIAVAFDVPFSPAVSHMHVTKFWSLLHCTKLRVRASAKSTVATICIAWCETLLKMTVSGGKVMFRGTRIQWYIVLACRKQPHVHIVQAQLAALKSSKSETKKREWVLPAHQVDIRNGSGVVGWLPCSSAAHSVPQSRSGTSGGPVPGLARVAIGNKALMADLGLETKHVEQNKWLRGEQDRGRTALYVAVGNNIEALVTVQDPIKPEARGTIARLMSSRVRC
jgi:hypothetical protein